MILVGNQRSGGKQLALHLLKPENDHVTVHEMRGFVSETLQGAFNEAYAISRGTKCKQYLFSLSLNPPKDAQVSTAVFEDAIRRVEEQLGLVGQPRAIVFHDKHGRRHAHSIWSRIKADEMKAVHLHQCHNKLMEVARDLFLEHGWQMPRGLAKSSERDPKNFTLAQWQQAKRRAKDPRIIKTALQDAWAISDDKSSLEHALEERGYKLARGDRRGFVAVDIHGEVYSIPKWVGIKTKDVRSRLGDESELPSVKEVKSSIIEDLRPTIKRMKASLLEDVRSRNNELRERVSALVARQRKERTALEQSHQTRWWAECRKRQSRYRKGLRGLWDWARGENKKIKELNEQEAQAAASRDREELDGLVHHHLNQRRELVDLRSELAREFADARGSLRVHKNGSMDPQKQNRKRTAYRR